MYIQVSETRILDFSGVRMITIDENQIIISYKDGYKVQLNYINIEEAKRTFKHFIDELSQLGKGVE